MLIQNLRWKIIILKKPLQMSIHFIHFNIFESCGHPLIQYMYLCGQLSINHCGKLYIFTLKSCDVCNTLLVQHISRMECMLSWGAPTSMVGIPSLADMMGPIVDPQAESFLTTISYKIPRNTSVYHFLHVFKT